MALLTLAAFSAISGVLILLAFKATSNRRALTAARRAEEMLERLSAARGSLLSR